MSIFAAFLLLIGSLTASLHQASFAAPLPSDLSQLELPPGVQLEELEASLCRHSDGSLPDIPGRDENQPCKSCPLCAAFHHPPPLPIGSDNILARGWAADTPVLADRENLTDFTEIPDDRRPRAPPLT